MEENLNTYSRGQTQQPYRNFQKKHKIINISLVKWIPLMIVIIVLNFFLIRHLLWQNYYNKIFKSLYNCKEYEFSENGYKCKYYKAHYSEDGFEGVLELKMPEKEIFNGEISYTDSSIYEYNGNEYYITVTICPNNIFGVTYEVWIDDTPSMRANENNFFSSESIGYMINEKYEIEDYKEQGITNDDIILYNSLKEDIIILMEQLKAEYKENTGGEK